MLTFKELQQAEGVGEIELSWPANDLASFNDEKAW